MAENKNIKRIISSPLVQTFLIYVSGSWIVLEMTDYFISHYDLTDRFRDILLIIMIIGLPVALFLTWYLSSNKDEVEEKDKKLLKVMLKRPWFSIPGAIVVVLLLFSAVRYIYQSDTRIPNNRDAIYPNIATAIKKANTEISLAVLPFTNFTGNSDQDWLVSGQHETLINELSKISQVKPLRVISRRTVDAFKNYDKPIPDLAREIDVEYLVEASVMGSGDSITLQLRLIQVYPEESVIWAQSCSSDFSNILKLHSDIASQIAQNMNIEMSPEDIEKIPLAREVNPESYKAYLRGMYHLNQLTEGSVEKGLEYLHEAVRIDPGEPFAYAGLALGYIEIAHGPFGTEDDLIKAEAAVAQAFKLDTTMAEIYAALAELYFYKTWDFDKMEANFIKALELNPNLALTHYHYSWALFVLGRMEEAIEEHKLAKRYDPFNPLHTAWLGGLYCYDRQYEKALETVNESFEIQKDYSIGYYVLGITYLQMGKTEEAIKAHKKLVELYPGWPWGLGYTYAVAGYSEEAKKIAREMEQGKVGGWEAFGLTAIYSGLNDMDNAFKWLTYEPHHVWVVGLHAMPEFENMRNDPRYQDFSEHFNWPE